MSTRILVLNDGRNYANWGIVACFDGLLRILEQHFPGAIVSTLSHAYMHKEHAFELRIFGKPVFSESNRILKRFPRFHTLPTIADDFEEVADLWLSGNGGPGVSEFIEKAQNSDIVIFNAEGSTYRNNLGAIKGLFMLWFAKEKLGKHVFFMNGSVTLTLVDACLPGMIRKTFEAIDGATIREPYSYRNILEFYPHLSSHVVMAPDSVFTLDLDGSSPPPLPFLDHDFFVVSRSMLPMNHTGALVELINHLKHIVPHTVLFAKDSEDQVLRRVADMTDSYFVGPDYSYHQIASILHKARFLVSGRYHHTIFATMVGCPCIPLATSSQKIHGLSELFSMMPTPLDPTDLSYTQPLLLRSAQTIIDSGDSLRLDYKERSQEICDTIFSETSQLFLHL